MLLWLWISFFSYIWIRVNICGKGNGSFAVFRYDDFRKQIQFCAWVQRSWEWMFRLSEMRWDEVRWYDVRWYDFIVQRPLVWPGWMISAGMQDWYKACEVDTRTCKIKTSQQPPPQRLPIPRPLPYPLIRPLLPHHGKNLQSMEINKLWSFRFQVSRFLKNSCAIVHAHK
jgi:hypothetical protein